LHSHDSFTDPRALPLQARLAARNRMQREQSFWLARLEALAEPPRPGQDFPAFLLATQPFAALAGRLRGATARAQLPAAVADELDWFLRAFGDYLRSCDGEDVFSSPPRCRGC
jgi:hypothetical protein